MAPTGSINKGQYLNGRGSKYMIRVYADLIEEQEKQVHNNVAAIVEIVTIDREKYDYLFPEVIYETRREECRNAVKDLILWCEDSFDHVLPTPLHEYALYSIFLNFEELDQDFQKDFNEGSIVFENIPRNDERNLDSYRIEDWEIQDIDFYIENFFQDHDFSYVPLLVQAAHKQGLHNLEKHLGINLRNFSSLMPPDIVEELFNDTDKEPTAKEDEITEQTKSVIEVVREAILEFKHAIEHNGKHSLLWNDTKVPRNEKTIQDVFDITTKSLFLAQNIDLSSESKSGRGFVDFKCSRGKERVLIETKLAKHKKIKAGLSNQLVHYLQAEGIAEGVYLVIGFTEGEMAIIPELEKMATNLNRKHDLKIRVIGVNAGRDKLPPSSLSDSSPNSSIIPETEQGNDEKEKTIIYKSASDFTFVNSLCDWINQEVQDTKLPTNLYTYTEGNLDVAVIDFESIHPTDPPVSKEGVFILSIDTKFKENTNHFIFRPHSIIRVRFEELQTSGEAEDYTYLAIILYIKGIY